MTDDLITRVARDLSEIVRLSKADATEVVTRCFAAGWGWNDIEKRTGVKPDRYVESAKANHLRERRAG